ncbi:MAG TPA: exodeoxyribonuclease III [Verrucomicrobiales bacterium]|nr:exodeoxyribonuclease III [Verrucomicrobiales bacterium]
MPQPLKLVSWNVNGLRAALNAGFADFALASRPDLLCLQEIKARPEQIPAGLWQEDCQAIWNPAAQAGYAGTAVFSRVPPLSVRFDIDFPEPQAEGRVITVEFPQWFLVNVYTPNARDGLRRLDYRMAWDRAFLEHLRALSVAKPVVFCGDLNVAHREIDLARPAANRRNPGFTDEERAGFDALLQAGFVDAFRLLHPEPDCYTWWSYRARARERNVGWRIDYWCLSELLRPRIRDARILANVYGSDHCPVELLFDPPRRRRR